MSDRCSFFCIIYKFWMDVSIIVGWILRLFCYHGFALVPSKKCYKEVVVCKNYLNNSDGVNSGCFWRPKHWRSVTMQILMKLLFYALLSLL